jgi:ribonuclease HI
MIVAVWVKVMELEAPNVDKSVFIDDKSIRTKERKDFERAFEVTDEFDRLCDQRLNVEKVVAFATDPKDRSWLNGWSHKGQKLKEVKDAVTLGYEISVNKRGSRGKQKERTEKAAHTTERIKNMSAPTEAKRRMLEGKALPQVVAGTAVALLPKTPADVLASQVLRAAWGPTFALRAPELAHGVVLNPLRFHPFWASIGEGVRSIARAILKKPSIGEKFKRVLELRSLTDRVIKNGPVANLEKAAGALGYRLNGNLTLSRDSCHDIPVTGQELRWVNKRIEEAARDRILDELKKRCQEECANKNNFRKDFEKALAGDIDFVATCALKNRRARRKRDKEPKDGSVGQAIEEFIGKAPLSDEQRRWWEVLVTGALRTGQRLNSARIKIKGKDEIMSREWSLCQGGHEEDVSHVVWECKHPEQEKIRAHFRRVLDRVISVTRNSEERAFLADPLVWPKCLRTHGIMPRPPDDDVDPVVAGSDIAVTTRMPLLGARMWDWLDAKIAQFLCERKDKAIVVYTDGAASDPGDIRRARAGYGVFYYDSCPWNVSGILGGFYQGPDRAELRAALHVAETSEPLTDTIVKSDNSAVVEGIAALNAAYNKGSKKPKFQANFDLWKRVEEQVWRHMGRFNAEWIKGHAEQDLVDHGGITAEERYGNHRADELAVHGRKKHPQNPQSGADAKTRKQVAMITQMMAIKILMNRSRMRKEQELEEEEEKGEEIALGLTSVSERPGINQTCKGLEELFPPGEDGGDEKSKKVFDKLIERFPNAIRTNPTGGGVCVKLGSIPRTLSEGRTRWSYPIHWLLPLKWYWEHLEFPCEDDELSRKGVSWLELVTDFEIATRVMLCGTKVTRKGCEKRKGSHHGKGSDTVAQRMYNFAAASRRTLQICGGAKLPQSTSIGTLFPYGGRSVAGHPNRPRLMNPEAVFRELATQALTHARAFALGQPTSGYWKWPPRYVSLPRQTWTGSPCSFRAKDKPKRRLRGKGPIDRPSVQTSAGRAREDERDALPPSKRVRLIGKQTPRISLGACIF